MTCFTASGTALTAASLCRAAGRKAGLQAAVNECRVHQKPPCRRARWHGRFAGYNPRATRYLAHKVQAGAGGMLLLAKPKMCRATWRTRAVHRAARYGPAVNIYSLSIGIWFYLFYECGRLDILT